MHKKTTRYCCLWRWRGAKECGQPLHDSKEVASVPQWHSADIYRWLVWSEKRIFFYALQIGSRQLEPSIWVENPASCARLLSDLQNCGNKILEAARFVYFLFGSQSLKKRYWQLPLLWKRAQNGVQETTFHLLIFLLRASVQWVILQCLPHDMVFMNCFY